MIYDTIVIPIHGTFALKDENKSQWWYHGSQFEQYARAYGLYYLYPDRPFRWSSDVDGLGINSLIGRKTHNNDWDAGGFSLENYLSGVPFEDRNLIAHSHGMQVVYNCNLQIRRLITIGSPIRWDVLKKAFGDEDIGKIKEKYNERITKHLHIYEPGHDKWQFLGQIGDGRFGKGKMHPLAHINDPIKGINHSKILSDPNYFHYWKEREWFEFMR